MKAKLLLAALFISSFFYGQFTEDFESYSVGAMGSQNPSLWNTWFGDYDLTSSVQVSNSNANSGTKSAYFIDAGVPGDSNYIDAILNLGNKTSGKWKLSFKMYIPTGKSVYFNLQSSLTPQGGAAQTSEAFMANFSFNSSAGQQNGQPVTHFYSYEDKSNATTFSFPNDTWFDVELLFNKDNDSFTFKINGVVLNSIAMPFQYYDDNPSLGGVDFMAIDASDEYWIDDIVFALDNTIPDTHLIPDLNLEQALVNLGLDTNGLTGDISYADAANITSLDVSNLNIETLYGVEKFVNLTSLNASNNNLDKINLSTLTSLQTLNLSNNNLSTIDLSNNNTLVNLNISNNNLNGYVLNLASKPNLTSINVSNTNLLGLNIANGNNTSLTSFNATNCNNFSCIQVDDVTYADTQVGNSLWFKDAGTSFNTNCNIPTTYVVSDTNLEQLLVNLGIDTNGMSGDILVNDPLNITTLDISNNSISDATGLDKFLNLEDLNASNNQLTTLDVSNFENLQSLNVAQNQLSSLDVSNNTSLVSLTANDNQLNGNNVVFKTTNTNTVQLSASLQTLIVNNNPLNNLDISGLVNLETLQANNTNLSVIDVTNNAQLKNLRVETNNISTVDISNNTALVTFWARYNRITNFNALNHLSLTQLLLSDQQVGNKLTSLDVTGAPALQYLYFSFNELTSIDLSNNNSLLALDAKENLLSGDIDLSSKSNLTQLSIRNNNLTAINVANGNNVNMTAFLINNNPNLTCVQVDDVTYADTQVTNGLWFKDAGTSFSGDCFTLLLNEDFASTKFNVYPNPVKNQFHINSIETITNLTIFDLTGKKVKEVTTNFENIDVSELENGIYLVKINSDSKTEVKKIIKE